jgi:hypothetical protein
LDAAGAGRCAPDVAALEHELVVGDGRDAVVVLQVLPHVTGLVLPDRSTRKDHHAQRTQRCKKDLYGLSSGSYYQQAIDGK